MIPNESGAGAEPGLSAPPAESQPQTESQSHVETPENRSPPTLRRAALPVALGAIVVLLFFGALLGPDRVLMVRDIPMFHLPLRLDWSLLARQGLPYWNPAINNGQPILSNPNYASFYPPTWLALVMPIHQAMSVITLLHVGWAFAGAWLLARRLGCRPSVCGLAAVAFVASGVFVATINNFTLFCGLAWMPWVLHWGELALRGADRSQRTRGVVLTGVAIGAQILSGEPYSPTLGALALLCATASGGGRIAARLGRVAASIALAAGIGALQLVPTALHVADSPRSAGFTGSAVEQTLTWSTRPNRLVEWIFPHLRGNPTQAERGLFFGKRHHDRGSGYLPSIYVGILVLILAATAISGAGARNRAVWIALVAVGVALALGRHDPLYAKVLVRIPPCSLLRFPEKFMLLATTGLTFAAAMAWENILEQRVRGELSAARRASWISLAVALLAVGLFVLPFVRPDLARDLAAGGSGEEAITTIEARRLGLLGFEALVTTTLGLVSFGILRLHRTARVRERWLCVAVLAVVGLDLYRVGNGYVIVASARDLFTPPPVVASLPAPSARIWTDHLFFPESTVERFDAKTKGSLPVHMVRYRDHLYPYWGNLYGYTYGLNEDFDMMLTSPAQRALDIFRNQTQLVEVGLGERAQRYLGAWNACNLVRRRDMEELRQVYQETGEPPGRVVILGNPYCLGRFRFVPAARVHADPTTAMEAARQQEFDVRQTEHLIARPDAPNGADGATRAYTEGAAFTRVEDRGARLDISYDSPGPALMVAAITWDRSWRATIDGEAAPVFETSIGQMAVEVPAGSHRVTIRFRDHSVFAGVAVTLVALAIALSLLWLNRRDSPAPAAPRSLPA